MRILPIRTLQGVVLAASLAACGGLKVEHNYPVEVPGSQGRYVPSDQLNRGGLFGDDGLFGGSSRRQEDQGGGIGVNALLWRASLETVSFMPITSADPFGGVIITDWYATPAQPNDRFKVTVYILDRQLRADGLRASVFRQTRDNAGNWADVPADPRTGVDMENAILTRAREMRISMAGLK